MGLGANKLSAGKSSLSKDVKKSGSLKLAAKVNGAQKLATGSRVPLVNKPSGAPPFNKNGKLHLANVAPPVPKPAPVPIDPRFLPFQALLLAKKAELTGSLGDTRIGAHAHNGRVAEEDQASVSHEEFISSKRNNMEFRMLRLVNAALARIDRGEYGECHACEEPISDKRLNAIPWAPYCVHCQDSHASNGDDISEAATPAGAAAIQVWNW